MTLRQRRRPRAARGTFEELAARYVTEYSKKKNKSWQQAEKLVQRNLLLRLGKLQADKVTRSDVKAAIAAMLTGNLPRSRSRAPPKSSRSTRLGEVVTSC